MTGKSYSVTGKVTVTEGKSSKEIADQAQKRIERLTGERDEARQAYETIVSDLSARIDGFTESAEEVSRLQTRISELEREYRTETQELKEAKGKLAGKITELRTYKTELEASIQTLQTRYDNDTARLSQEKGQVEGERNEARRLYGDKDAQVGDLRTRLGQAQGQKRSAEQNYRAKDAEARQLTEQLGQAQGQRNTSEQHYQEIHAQEASLRTQLGELSGQLQELRLRNARLEGRLEQPQGPAQPAGPAQPVIMPQPVNCQAETLRGEFTRIYEAMQAIRGQFTGEIEYRELRADFRNLEDRFNEARHELGIRQSELTQVTSEKTLYQGRFEQAEIRLTQLGNVITDLQGRLTNAGTETRQERDQRTQLQIQLAEANRLVNEVQTTYTALINGINTKVNTLVAQDIPTKLNALIQGTADMITAYQALPASLRTEMTNLVNTINTNVNAIPGQITQLYAEQRTALITEIGRLFGTQTTALRGEITPLAGILNTLNDETIPDLSGYVTQLRDRTEQLNTTIGNLEVTVGRLPEGLRNEIRPHLEQIQGHFDQLSDLFEGYTNRVLARLTEVNEDVINTLGPQIRAIPRLIQGQHDQQTQDIQGQHNQQTQDILGQHGQQIQDILVQHDAQTQVLEEAVRQYSGRFWSTVAAGVAGAGLLTTILFGFGSSCRPNVVVPQNPPVVIQESVSKPPILHYDPTPCMEFRRDGANHYVSVTVRETGKTPIMRLAEIDPAYEEMLTNFIELVAPAGSDERTILAFVDDFIKEVEGKKIIDTNKLKEAMKVVRRGR